MSRAPGSNASITLNPLCVLGKGSWILESVLKVGLSAIWPPMALWNDQLFHGSLITPEGQTADCHPVPDCRSSAFSAQLCSFPALLHWLPALSHLFKCFVIVQTVRKSQCPRHGDSLAWIFLPKIITFLFVQTKCLGRGCLPHSVLLKLPSPRIRADNKHHSKGHHLLSTSYVLSDWEYRI